MFPASAFTFANGGLSSARGRSAYIQARCEATHETLLLFIGLIAAGEKAERDKPHKLHTHSKFIRSASKYLCGQTNKQIP